MAGTRLLYVAGTGRSGSTVFANTLGEIPGCVSVGELRYLWERGLGENRLCGCGERFADCPFWREVLDVAFGQERPDAAQMSDRQRRAGRLRMLPALLARRRHPERVTAGLGALPEALSRLYAAVLQVSGGRVVVDSSKLPTYAVLLDSLGSLDVHLVHLVRDPRAAAFSWRRVKAQPDRHAGALMERRGVAKSAALWVIWNVAAERLWRHRRAGYLRLRYESFTSAPREVVEAVAARVDLDADLSSVFVDDSTVLLRPSHTVAGNPARLRSGPVRLRRDDEWMTGMRRRDRVLVTVLAAPLMLRYGYPLSARRPRPR